MVIDEGVRLRNVQPFLLANSHLRSHTTYKPCYSSMSHFEILRAKNKGLNYFHITFRIKTVSHFIEVKSYSSSPQL